MKHIKLFENFDEAKAGYYPVTALMLKERGIKAVVEADPRLRSWFMTYGLAVSGDKTYNIFDDEDFWDDGTREFAYQLTKDSQDPEVVTNVAWSELLNYINTKNPISASNSLEVIFKAITPDIKKKLEIK
jgi:hypothetical protein